jgi:hypothetical protein
MIKPKLMANIAIIYISVVRKMPYEERKRGNIKVKINKRMVFAMVFFTELHPFQTGRWV